MNIDQMEKQKHIVVDLAQFISEDWRRIVLSYEVGDGPDLLEQDTMLSYITGPLDNLKKVSLTGLPDKVRQAVFELSKMMADVSGRTWSSCELIIDASGHYNFSFSYDPPKRINGIYDEQSYGRYNNYLDIYKAEIAATTVPGQGKS